MITRVNKIKANVQCTNPTEFQSLYMYSLTKLQFLFHCNLQRVNITFSVRLEELVDTYVEKTVKFVYVHWIGESVPFIKKGKFGVVHGSIEEHFQVSFDDKYFIIINCYFFFEDANS